MQQRFMVQEILLNAYADMNLDAVVYPTANPRIGRQPNAGVQKPARDEKSNWRELNEPGIPFAQEAESGQRGQCQGKHCRAGGFGHRSGMGNFELGYAVDGAAQGELADVRRRILEAEELSGVGPAASIES